MKNSPWGIPDTVDKIAKGFYWVSTPSHGGYMVSKALAESLLPKSAIDSGFLGIPWGGYYCYEEDCAYAVLMHFVLNRSPFDSLRIALELYLQKSLYQYPGIVTYKEKIRNTVAHWYPAELQN